MCEKYYQGVLVVLWLGHHTCNHQAANLMHCWVSTWIGDPLRAGKLSRYVTIHPVKICFSSSVLGISSSVPFGK